MFGLTWIYHVWVNPIKWDVSIISIGGAETKGKVQGNVGGKVGYFPQKSKCALMR